MEVTERLDRRACCVICTVGGSAITKGGTGSVDILEYARRTRILAASTWTKNIYLLLCFTVVSWTKIPHVTFCMITWRIDRGSPDVFFLHRHHAYNLALLMMGVLLREE